MRQLMNFLKYLTTTSDLALPPKNRNWPLEYDWVPESENEFFYIVNNASVKTFGGFGFQEYDFEFPSIMPAPPDTEVLFQLEPPLNLLLFPAEWYDVIPAGFVTVDIEGRLCPFYHGVSCNEQWFGCLVFGILNYDIPDFQS